jgi:hypothetical protein
MFAIGVILTLLGVLGILAGLVMWALRLKNSKVFLRNGVIALLLGGVFTIVGAPPSQPSQPTQPTQSTQAAQETQTTQPAQPAPQEKEVQASAVQEEKLAQEEKPAQEEPAPPVIPGLHWVDITLSLEREPFGFRFTLERNKFTPTFERRAKNIDPDTGAEMVVRVVSYGDKVVFYEAMVSGLGADLTATWFIPLLATAPFDGNPQMESKRWAEEALGKVRQGQPVERRVGEVVMTLSGTPPSLYTLEVSHKGYKAYLSKVLR